MSKKDTSPKKAIIIGAGVAGLAAAIRLAVKGYAVQVFEKNDYVGGKLSHFALGDYQFDAGPSLFTEPENIEALFQLAGEPIEEYFSYQKVDISCQYFFASGKKVTAYAAPERLAQEMEVQLGEDPAAIRKYLKRSAHLYKHVGQLFLEKSLHKPGQLSLRQVGKAIASVRLPYLTQSLHKYNQKQLRTSEAVQLFNRYATYNGSDPYKAPAMLSLIPHLEMNQGTYYPHGGMISITYALHRLAIKLGVAFSLGTAVQQILTLGNQVTGVMAQDHFHAADIVVSNQDVYFTYQTLLQRPLMARKVLLQERSSSALIFYWGIGRSFPQLHLHNIFFSANYRDEFHKIFNTYEVTDDPTVYINITSKMEAGQAPPGKENWFVMVNVPANRGQNWANLQQQVRKAVLQKLSRELQTDVEACIEEETCLDPVLIEKRTMSYMGSLYGTSSNSRMAAFLRHPNFSRQYANLFYVGGSVHPGGGIPLCLRSAAIATQMVP